MILKGFQSVFLGQSVPIESLNTLVDIGEPITFISYFTIEPTQDKVEAYLNTFHSEIIENMDSELWVLGYQVQFIEKELPNKMHSFTSIDQLVEALTLV